MKKRILLGLLFGFPMLLQGALSYIVSAEDIDDGSILIGYRDMYNQNWQAWLSNGKGDARGKILVTNIPDDFGANLMSGDGLAFERGSTGGVKVYREIRDAFKSGSFDRTLSNFTIQEFLVATAPDRPERRKGPRR